MTESEKIEFKKELWKNKISYRTKMAKYFLKKKALIGKTKKEIEALFGKEENYYDLDEWSYEIKKNMLGGQIFLLLDFNNDDYVKNLRIYRVYSLGETRLLAI